jgi:hypothetical protein
MTRPETLARFYIGLALTAVLAICGGCPSKDTPQTSNAGAQAKSGTALSVNDVSILFPGPATAADMKRIIAVSDIVSPNAQDASKSDPVWPAAVFQQFVGIANSNFSQVGVAGGQKQIGLPAAAQSVTAWFVSGIRIDAGAPGLSSDVRAQFGQLPEIRLIIQPITLGADGTPKVLDIAGHLIFDFINAAQDPPPPGTSLADCRQRPTADTATFSSVVADVTAIRDKLRDGKLGGKKVDTAGLPLGVHPGLLDATTATNLRAEILAFLGRHISAQRLDAMAIAGLPNGAPAPWIFLSMVKVPPGVVPTLPNGGFAPVNGPTLDGVQFAELFQPAGTIPRVVPEPHTNNLNAITCKNAAVSKTSMPVANRSGVATAELFAATPPSPERIGQVLSTVADPNKSHFFNTDCVSCHTETRRAMDLQGVKDIPGLNPAVLPGGQWNIRNFGWSPTGKGAQATATRRALNETTAVVNAINAGLPSQ